MKIYIELNKIVHLKPYISVYLLLVFVAKVLTVLINFWVKSKAQQGIQWLFPHQLFMYLVKENLSLYQLLAKLLKYGVNTKWAVDRVKLALS